MWNLRSIIFVSYVVENVIAVLLTMKGTEFISYDVTSPHSIATEELHVICKFKTIDPSALLIFSENKLSEDYISLELIDGKLR